MTLDYQSGGAALVLCALFLVVIAAGLLFAGGPATMVLYLAAAFGVVGLLVMGFAPDEGGVEA